MNSIHGVPDVRDLHSGGTIGSLIVNAIARFGDSPALADGKVNWNYREFGDAVARFITFYRSMDLKKVARFRFSPAIARNPGPQFARRW
jgi:fatty-acyl-CoA synthase